MFGIDKGHGIQILATRSDSRARPPTLRLNNDRDQRQSYHVRQ